MSLPLYLALVHMDRGYGMIKAPCHYKRLIRSLWLRHTLLMLDPIPLWGTNAERYEGISVCAVTFCISHEAKQG